MPYVVDMPEKQRQDVGDESVEEQVYTERVMEILLAQPLNTLQPLVLQPQPSDD